ncbi:MAG: hypothetical protein IKI88_04425 [Anaerotignum sp.]|nr:hypothetical protein [Anaerotignum sp.]
MFRYKKQERIYYRQSVSSGAAFLADRGTTASYYYGLLQPKEEGGLE